MCGNGIRCLAKFLRQLEGGEGGREGGREGRENWCMHLGSHFRKLDSGVRGRGEKNKSLKCVLYFCIDDS